MPLRPDAEEFLPQLERHRQSGATVLSLNVHFGELPWQDAFKNLAIFRSWVTRHDERYRLIETINDIEAAKARGQLGIVFDLEGGIPVEPHPGMVELYYRLGVRWMLIAYNKNNKLGGGCQDDDIGLTDYGRRTIDAMEQVGMVLCCSHTGYRTAREAMDYANNPVIFSHSNVRSLCDHPRNVPDDLIRRCAETGGVINLNGFGLFLGGNDVTTGNLLRHVNHIADLVGPEHVGLGLDYVFDQKELDAYVLSRPDIFPPDKGYIAGMTMIEPERIPAIAEALLEQGFTDEQVVGVLGGNNLRVARQVWK
jgi:membrane dipeptidase